MQEVAKQPGGWSVTDLRCWMIIRWSSLIGSDVVLPDWVTAILKVIFPPGQYEGVAVDLLQASVDYGLNEIPSATCQVAVGRRADDVNVVAAIHYLVKRLKLFVGCSIWCKGQVTSQSGVADAWPTNTDGSPKPFRIFDGYIIGTGFRKTSRGVEFNISATNWLSDLNFSSATSRSSSALNPSQLSYDASQSATPNSGGRGSGGPRNAAAVTEPGPLFNGALLHKDMWANTVNRTSPALGAGAPSLNSFGGLKQWLTELCLRDRINWRQIQRGTCGGLIDNISGKKNVEALAALNRIEPLSNGYLDGVPLQMDDRPNMLGNLANQLASSFGKQSAEVMAGNTIWDKLIAWGSDLQFAVVPQVEKAMLVPFNPGLRRSWATVLANEYDFFERSDHIPRPLRGVGLFVGIGFSAGGHPSLNNNPVYDAPGPYYENPDRRNGLIIWKHAPAWLATVIMPHLNSVLGGGVIANSTLDTNAAVGPNLPPPKCKFEAIKPFWCDYARGLYIQEILRGRNARLSGRLRFDIAPGSIIRVEEPEEPFVLSQVGGVSSYIWGQVIRVSCVINSEAQKAGTAMQIAFVKDTDENADASYSTDRHPIWAYSWYGAPLVNDKAFYPGGDFPGVSPPELPPNTITTNGCTGTSITDGIINDVEILPPLPPGQVIV